MFVFHGTPNEYQASAKASDTWCRSRQLPQVLFCFPALRPHEENLNTIQITEKGPQQDL